MSGPAPGRPVEQAPWTSSRAGPLKPRNGKAFRPGPLVGDLPRFAPAVIAPCSASRRYAYSRPFARGLESRRVPRCSDGAGSPPCWGEPPHACSGLRLAISEDPRCSAGGARSAAAVSSPRMSRPPSSAATFVAAVKVSPIRSPAVALTVSRSCSGCPSGPSIARSTAATSRAGPPEDLTTTNLPPPSPARSTDESVTASRIVANPLPATLASSAIRTAMVPKSARAGRWMATRTPTTTAAATSPPIQRAQTGIPPGVPPRTVRPRAAGRRRLGRWVRRVSRGWRVGSSCRSWLISGGCQVGLEAAVTDGDGRASRVRLIVQRGSDAGLESASDRASMRFKQRKWVDPARWTKVRLPGVIRRRERGGRLPVQ